MHLNFIKDVYRILFRRHLKLAQRLMLIKAFVLLKIRHKKASKHDPETPIKFLNYKVYTDNFGDFFATFNEIFIKEEYFFSGYLQIDTVIDAGANIGLATLYFKWLNDKVRVIGFERDEDTFYYYNKNVIENNLNDVLVNNFAVGGEESELLSYGSHRATTIYKNIADSLPEKGEPEREKTVQVKKLSNFLQTGLQIHLKMDIEGAEIDVLHELQDEGLLSGLTSMIFEFHFNEESKYLEVKSLLEANTFFVERGALQKNGNFMISAVSKH